MAALVAAMLAGDGSSQQQPAFRSGVDLVSFAVTVADRKGGLVTSLDASDFEVYEDGQKQTVTHFSTGGTEGAPGRFPGELHLGVLLDISGSMEADLNLARTAAIKFLNTLTEASDFTVVEFDTQVRMTRYGQHDFPRLVERLRSRRSEGYTALYDAIGVYLDGASSDSGRKILVLYSDGADNSSSITMDEVRDLLRASDVTVYAIGFLEHLPSASRFQIESLLRQMAEITGGQLFIPSSMKNLEASYEKVRAEIAAQYSLGYTSTNARTDGTWRNVEIKLARPERQALRVRTRSGYFAPYRQPPGLAGH